MSFCFVVALLEVFFNMAVGQNQWYHFGVGAPPILVYFSWGLGCSLGVRDFDPWPYGNPIHSCCILNTFARPAAPPTTRWWALVLPESVAVLRAELARCEPASGAGQKACSPGSKRQQKLVESQECGKDSAIVWNTMSFTVCLTYVA